MRPASRKHRPEEVFDLDEVRVAFVLPVR